LDEELFQKKDVFQKRELFQKKDVFQKRELFQKKDVFQKKVEIRSLQNTICVFRHGGLDGHLR
jgi:hypothetical protein